MTVPTVHYPASNINWFAGTVLSKSGLVPAQCDSTGVSGNSNGFTFANRNWQATPASAGDVIYTFCCDCSNTNITFTQTGFSQIDSQQGNGGSLAVLARVCDATTAAAITAGSLGDNQLVVNTGGALDTLRMQSWSFLARFAGSAGSTAKTTGGPGSLATPLDLGSSSVPLYYFSSGGTAPDVINNAGTVLASNAVIVIIANAAGTSLKIGRLRLGGVGA